MNFHEKYKPVFTINLANRTLQLTREGGGFILLAFAVGIGAINTGNNLLYLILAMCCSFIALSGVLSEMTLRDVWVEAYTPKTLYAEDVYPIRLNVANHKKIIPSFSLYIELPPDPESRFDGGDPALIYNIPAGKTVTKNLMFTPRERGYLNISDCKLTTSFPFGFFVKSKSIDIYIQAIVFPHIRDINIPNSSGASMEGNGDVKASGEELSSLREFRPGDPINAVYWKASAKTGNMRVKEFSGGDSQSFTISLNTVNPQTGNLVAPDILEKRVIESASLAYCLIRNGNEVKFKTHDFETDYGMSERHLETIMKYLALVGKESIPSSAYKQEKLLSNQS